MGCLRCCRSLSAGRLYQAFTDFRWRVLSERVRRNALIFISFPPGAWLSWAVSPRPLVRAARLSDARGSSRMLPDSLPFGIYLAKRLPRFLLGFGGSALTVRFRSVPPSFSCLWPIDTRLCEFFRSLQQPALRLAEAHLSRPWPGIVPQLARLSRRSVIPARENKAR